MVVQVWDTAHTHILTRQVSDTMDSAEVFRFVVIQVWDTALTHKPNPAGVAHHG